MNIRRLSRVRQVDHGPVCWTSRAWPRGFTLIELLVVISIIVLLIAIVVPVMSMTRRAALTTQCLSNLRQIGVLVNVYLIDSNGFLPTMQNRASINEPLPAMDTVLVGPSDSKDIFQCPADEAEIWASSGSSYFWNFTVNGQNIDQLDALIGGSDPSSVPLVLDKEGFHLDLPDKVNVLYPDGRADKELVFSTELP